MGNFQKSVKNVIRAGLVVSTALSTPAMAEGSSQIFNDCVVSGLQETFPDSTITVSHSNDRGAITNLRVKSPRDAETSHNLHLHTASWDDNSLVNVAHASGKVNGERVESIRREHPRTLGYQFFTTVNPEQPREYQDFLKVISQCPTHLPLGPRPENS